MTKNNLHIGDYVLINKESGIILLAFRTIHFEQAYKVVGFEDNSMGRLFHILDHNSEWPKSLGERDARHPCLVGKKYCRFHPHSFTKIVSPTCPLAKKAVVFWRECFAQTPY